MLLQLVAMGFSFWVIVTTASDNRFLSSKSSTELSESDDADMLVVLLGLYPINMKRQEKPEIKSRKKAKRI